MGASMDNNHTFDFEFPLIPCEQIGKPPGHMLKMNMDGNPLTGVTGVNIKAGSNGFTNVAIEFEAPCAAQFAGVLSASIRSDLDCDQRLADIYSEVKQEVLSSMDAVEQDELDVDIDAKAEFVRSIIAKCIERL
jgi:hypothetical protein